ncbi:MAG: hypothetical protein ABI761_19420 [Saprospiraceae bacterium]
MDKLNSNQAGTIAGIIAGAGIDDKFLKTLTLAENAASRSEVLAKLN